MDLTSCAAALITLAGAASPHAGKHPEVQMWTPTAVTSGDWESHPAIDPTTGDLWFVRSDKTFSGWRILVSPCRDGQWTMPKESPIAAPGIEADPYFTADGKSLYFISSRATGQRASNDLDIWLAKRDASGKWQAPTRLPEPVNSDKAEWFPRPAPDGWLYFGSRREGGYGKDDIWRARQDNTGHWIVENAGPGFNTAEAEYEFQPSPGGEWGVLATATGLFRVEMTPQGWQRREKFDDTINATGTEIGPMITPDGKSFLYSRDADDTKSGELYIAWPSMPVK